MYLHVHRAASRWSQPNSPDLGLTAEASLKMTSACMRTEKQAGANVFKHW